MRQKILILMASYDTMYYFRGIADALIEQGCDVRVCPALPTKCEGGRYSVHQCNWHFFDMKYIHEFDPDRILIWNGFHEPFHAAVMALKAKYNVFHVELAWMSQKEFIYIDTEIGGSSKIYNGDRSYMGDRTPEQIRILKSLKDKYKVVDTGIKLPKDYILVPLQLEKDTSIVRDSPYFKTMDSLIGFVLNNAGRYPVVIKPHPKDLKDHTAYERFKSLQVLDTSSATIIDGKDVSINELAAKAKVVVGINSTSLIESLVHHKSTINFGNNVIMTAERVESLSTPNYIEKYIDGLPAEHRPEWEYFIDNWLLYLYANQVRIDKPQAWAIDKIANYTEESRTIGSLG